MKGRMINMKGEKYAIKRISILIVSILLMEIIISVFGISISYADERDKLVYVKMVRILPMGRRHAVIIQDLNIIIQLNRE